MATIGVLAAEHVAVGLVEDYQLSGTLRVFPRQDDDWDYLGELPPEEITRCLAEQIEVVAGGRDITAVGIGFPGIIRDGVITESPNLQQMKGQHLEDQLSALLEQRGWTIPVHVLNDADAMAAGIAASRGQLDQQVRVWWLGNGVGFGVYPPIPGAGEGGHLVVTLDPKEEFCRCGGRGHLEGIVGNRAMRLRFFDLEPDEIFEQAREGNQRCADFVKLWHRALAAATANTVHLSGPGKFYISGPNARFVQLGLLDLYVHEMVKMSPLQGSSFEVVATSGEIAVIGAAARAQQSISY
ncbi:MAG: ROK family protein [Blastocatellia bacterium]|nr:ROK family protein [Blastocatellia bacterium]